MLTLTWSLRKQPTNHPLIQIQVTRHPISFLLPIQARLLVCSVPDFRLVVRSARATRSRADSAGASDRRYPSIHGLEVRLLLRIAYVRVLLRLFYRDGLMQYLKPFAEQGKEVNESDIQTFFEARKQGQS